MKITFTEDHQSVASGNEFYREGAQADLRRGQGLIDMGVARAGWRPLLDPETREEIAVALETLALESLTKAELVDEAREAGISYAGLNKAQLIEVLSEVE